jgi:hypothetical protein
MMRATWARYLPLVAHVVPTLAIGFAWVIPQHAALSCARTGSCRVAKT